MFFIVLSNKLKTKENSFDEAWECIVYDDEAFCSKQHISYIDPVRSAHQSYRHYYEHPTRRRIIGLLEKVVFLCWKVTFRSAKLTLFLVV
jgi:hypothetical protein